MADYHPLISRAVTGLESNTGENRRVLYERARAALVNQLRSVDPPLEESDITRERLALEEAIRKVEADATKHAWPDEQAGAPQERPFVPRDQGLRGFRESVAEADNLGGAAVLARRSAREIYEAVPDNQRPRVDEGEAGPGVHYFEPPAAEQPPPVSEPDLIEETPHTNDSKLPRSRRRPMTRTSTTSTMYRRFGPAAVSSSWCCCSW
jgi:hypothetical protein